VVRNKDARRKLQAGACECCKDVSYFCVFGSKILTCALSNSTTRLLVLYLPACNHLYGNRLPQARQQLQEQFKYARFMANLERCETMMTRRMRVLLLINKGSLDIGINGRDQRHPQDSGISDFLPLRRSQTSTEQPKKCTSAGRHR
jgi:hypothetical protein